MWTYAQNFEDVILERLFKGENEGFYVDVGAWDPWHHSVTAHFYKKGWRGINIEPIEERLAAFDRNRPRDINLPVAISSDERPVSLWVCDQESYLSTTNSSQAAKLHERGSAITERLVSSRSLNSILEEYAPAEIAFLKIDVEGSEADVLATIDFNRWRPRVILIEATEPGARPSDWNPEEHGRWTVWEHALLDVGYVFGYFDGLNRFYLREEDRHLLERFRLPPGVFDEIENFSFVFEVQGQLERCKEERAEQRRMIQALKGKNDLLKSRLGATNHRWRRLARAVRKKLKSFVPNFGRRSGVEP